MYTLGINAHHADSSAALIKDGKILFAIEEERLTRIKHWAGFPEQSIKLILEKFNLDPSDISCIAVGRDVNAKRWRKLKFLVSNWAIARRLVFSRLENRNSISSINDQLEQMGFGESTNISYFEHHKSHHASAFYVSGFERSVCLSIDGSGDFTTASIALANEDGILMKETSDYPHSLGLLYTSVTQFLGFPHYGDEYKVMGLSPYGNPAYTEEIRSLISFDKERLLKISLDFFNLKDGVIEYQSGVPIVHSLFNSDKFQGLFGIAPRKPRDPIEQKHKDIAASLQVVTEQVIIELIDYAFTKYGYHSTNLCLSGGVAQNSVANGKILTKTKFKNLYVPAAGHDAGISIGAGLLAFYADNLYKNESPNYSALLGTEFSNNEVRNILKEYEDKVDYVCLGREAVLETAVSKLINNEIIGWFQGRCEFGPRALGNRSILANPANINAKDLINAKIKKREGFRPFAPSILHEHGPKYFQDYQFAPFMERVLKFKPGYEDLLPSVVHHDGSGRLQSVRSDENPLYHKLIQLFYQKSGVPILVNTSFNENEPVVENPRQAIDVLLRTSLDALIIGDYVVTRK